jgi:hypothetical protein
MRELTMICLLVGCFFGCSQNESAQGGDGQCIPGKSEACTCVDGNSGAQVCNKDKTFDECVCGEGGSKPKAKKMLEGVERDRFTQSERYRQGKLQKERGKTYVVDEYREKLRQQPDNPAYQYLLARMLEPADEEKYSLCQKAAQAHPDYAWAWYCLSYWEKEQNNGDKALEYASKAYKHGADFEHIKTNYEFLSMDWYPRASLDSIPRFLTARGYYSNVSMTVHSIGVGRDCLASLKRSKYGFRGTYGACMRVTFTPRKRGNSYQSYQFCGHQMKIRDRSGELLNVVTDLGCKDAPSIETDLLINLNKNQVVASIVLDPG